MADADQEIELKLALPRSKLKQATRLIARLPGAQLPSEEKLHAVYFDTPEQVLRRKGMVLRIRAELGRTVQTVKDEGAHLARGEWSDAIEGDKPDPGAGKSGRKIRQALGKKKLKSLTPQFQVRVQRTKVPLKRDGGIVEAAIDRGEIVNGARQKDAISEIELELKEGGSPATLYELALRLAQVLPLRPETRSKSARGFALSAPGPFKAVRSPKIALAPADTLGKALCEAGRAYLHQFEANIPGALAADVEAVHQMRVGLRRLRGVLGAAKKTLSPLQYEWIKERLKTVLQRLGPVRNWDVLREKLDAVPDGAHRRTSSHRALTKAAERSKAHAHAGAAEALQGRATTIALLEVHRWMERLASPEEVHAKHLETPLKKAAPKLLDRQFKKLRKRAANFDKLSADERHKLRIAAKNMRYTADFFCALYPAKDVKAFLDTLKPVQETLGALNDVRGAHDLLRTEKGRTAIAAGEVLGWMDRDAATVMIKARKALDRLCRTKPYW